MKGLAWAVQRRPAGAAAGEAFQAAVRQRREAVLRAQAPGSEPGAVRSVLEELRPVLEGLRAAPAPTGAVRAEWGVSLPAPEAPPWAREV